MKAHEEIRYLLHDMYDPDQSKRINASQLKNKLTTMLEDKNLNGWLGERSQLTSNDFTVLIKHI